MQMTDGGLQPWISWDYVHADYDLIAQLPTAVLPEKYLVQLRLVAGLFAGSPVVVFLFFGLRREVFEEYGKAVGWIVCLFSGRRGSEPASEIRREKQTTSSIES